VSEIPALTLTMSPEFSEEEFNHSDELILSKILKTFINRFPLAKIKLSELKKWRYCKPTTQSNKLFLEMAKGLYLIGDAFGGSSLLGAIRSSESLSNHLNENHK
jgi:predicted NAD/FAD-dependent oxidoreductase